MPRVDFFLCRDDQLVKQIVGLYAEPFTPADPDEGSRLVFLTQVVAELGSAAWSQHDHPVGEVRKMVGSFSVTQIAQGFLNCVLRFRLSYVDDVVVFGHVAEMRMILFAMSGGDPAVVVVRITVEPAISEVA